MDEPIHEPSIEEVPKLKLKTLPQHLKYAYLGPSEILPVIIVSDLDQTKKEKLLAVLKENREAIG